MILRKKSQLFSFQNFLFEKLLQNGLILRNFGAKILRKILAPKFLGNFPIRKWLRQLWINLPKWCILNTPTDSVIEWTIFILKKTAGVRIRSGKSRATHFRQLSSRHRSRLISCSPILGLLAPIFFPCFFKKSSDYHSYRGTDKTNPQSHSQTGVFTKRPGPFVGFRVPLFLPSPKILPSSKLSVKRKCPAVCCVSFAVGSRGILQWEKTRNQANLVCLLLSFTRL